MVACPALSNNILVYVESSLLSLNFRPDESALAVEHEDLARGTVQKFAFFNAVYIAHLSILILIKYTSDTTYWGVISPCLQP